MTAIAALYADHALRLANERQAAFRAEARADRLARHDGPGWPSRIRAMVAAAFSSVRVEPVSTTITPRLQDYPTRG